MSAPGRRCCQTDPKVSVYNRDRDGGVTVMLFGDRVAATIRLLFPSLSASFIVNTHNNCFCGILIHRQLVGQRPLVQGGEGT